MKTLLYTLLCCLSYSAFSQTLAINKSTTRALIIGISDYQDEHIPDLRFAHKDAEAFAAYLQSDAGGALPKENIILLTNNSATTGAMASGMDWLIEDSKKGDRVIIYFSGHGDVETRTKFQRGFLLTYDSPPSNYLAGAFATIFLQDIISTLADQGAQVIMVIDACRAGKLAGSEIGGTQATTANLTKQYVNEIKILSCQPHEFSIEGEQWGDGRGVFSYHLIEGLIGLADKNEDLKVNLLEVNRYLEEIVPAETAPQKQIPVVVGNKGALIARVDETALAILHQQKEQELPSISPIDPKGFEDLFLSKVDSIWQHKYQQFTVAINQGNLLEPGDSSAYAFYQQLLTSEELKPLHSLMRRNLATALQDESQQAFNAYLNVMNKELEDRSRGDLKYNKFAQYLEKATELLGSQHYIYNTLKAKQYYFEALDIRLRTSGRTYSLSDSFHIWNEWRKEKLLLALEYEEDGAFIYNELGKDYRAKGIPYLEKAISLAPTWAIPHVNISNQYSRDREFEKAQFHAFRSIELAPNSGLVYSNLGRNYNAMKNFEKAEEMFLKAVEKSPENIGFLHRLGLFYSDNNRCQEAETVWLKSLELSPKHIFSYRSLSQLYNKKTLEYDKAEIINRKKLEIRPTDGEAYCNLVTAYANSGQTEQLQTLIMEMQQVDQSITNWEGAVCLGYAYERLAQFDLAIEYTQKAIKEAPEGAWVYHTLARIYQDMQEYESFLENLDASLSKGMYFSWIALDVYFRAANKTPGFKAFAQSVIDRAPSQGFGRRLLALYYDSQGDFEKAEDLYKDALVRNPERALNWLHYAESRYLAGQTEQSDSLFRKYIQVSPGNEMNHIQVANFYRLHSEYEKAAWYLQQAFTKDPSQREALWNKAWILFSNKGLTAAVASLDEGIALQSSEDKKTILIYLKGLLYYFSDKPKESLTYFKKAAKQDAKIKPIVLAIKEIIKKNLPDAVKQMEKAMRLNPADDNLRYIYAQLKIQQGDYISALDHLNQAINGGEMIGTVDILQVGGSTYDFITNDLKIKAIQNLPQYTTLMKNYFPEKTEQ